MDEDSSGGYWKQNLYLLQEKAPQPIAVPCLRPIPSPPRQYGDEFHGFIERDEADRLLRATGEGAFLVRASKRSDDAYTLCMLFDGRVLNYKLFYDGTHYVGEKRFESITLLVADGLISMYMDKHAADYIRRMADEAIYDDSPYSQYLREPQTRITKAPVARAHSFIQHTFKMPHYCDFCRNFMWGLVQQGVRCTDCGFAAHKRCSERTLQDCRPEAKYVKRQFGVDLTTLCLAHGARLPPVLEACILEVEARGLSVEGIYRVSGSHDHIEKLRQQYDQSQNVDLTQVEDIHTVACLLKLYLRRLPQQLVPFHVYKSLLRSFINSTSIHERNKECKRALSELPEANARALDALLNHLRTVASRSHENKMSVENIATIFSPTLFCSGAMPALAQQQHVLLGYLIQTQRIVPLR